MDVDSMDVDTSPRPTPIRSVPQRAKASVSPDTLVRNALETLKAHLKPFITKHLVRALGEENLRDVAPTEDADVRQLLLCIQDRWLSTFCDSPLEDRKHAIERLQTLLRGVVKNRVVFVASNAIALEILDEVEAMLLCIGRRADAANVSRMRTQLATPTNASRAPSRTTQRAQTARSANPHPPQLPQQPLSQPLVAVPQRMQGAARMPVVLDAANVCWHHGTNKAFSLRGAYIAFAYYQTRNHPTTIFLPSARMSSPPAHDRKVYDQIAALRGTPALVLTPEADYDDAYIVFFARRNGAAVVSNDAFRDVVYQASADGPAAEAACQKWLSACRISFAFHGDNFLPNPTFDWSRAASAASQLRIS